jgi:hypothetical protein
MQGYFPTAIATVVGEYAALWQIDKFVTNRRFTDDEIVGAGDITEHICSNVMAMDIIDPSNINWKSLSENPADWALDLLEANRDMIYWYGLCRNTNKRAIKLLLEEGIEKLDYDDWEMLSTNSSALEIFRAHPQRVNATYLMWNPAANVIVKEMHIPLAHDVLVLNHADWAVDILLSPDVLPTIQDKSGLSSNTNPRIVAFLIANPTLINWDNFSGNVEAIEHLRANPEKLTPTVYCNPAIMVPTIPVGLVDILRLR